ncbi:MAG: methyltransferase domain-containing protein [Phycisphaerae bacterium]|nr:methyltransferase domain-containing protein [Phycisphaerae bacterium]
MTVRHTMKAQAREEFNAWAESYDQHYLNHFLFRPSYRVFMEELYRWRGCDGPLYDMLDVGCGSGTLVSLIAATDLPLRRLVALDYAEQMCRVAREKARKHECDHILYVNADSEHLPFPDESFDVITCSNSFHHYPHQQEVIVEMRRILRPQGRLMLIDGFRDNVVGWFVFDVCIGAVEKHVHHVPWSTVNRFFREAGFRQVTHRKFNWWFPGLLTVGVA